MLKYERDVEENQRRVMDMKEHFKNVQSEFVNIQGLLSSKQKELQSEKHLKQLSDREAGKIKVEIEKLLSEESELQNKVFFLTVSLH